MPARRVNPRRNLTVERHFIVECLSSLCRESDTSLCRHESPMGFYGCGIMCGFEIINIKLSTPKLLSTFNSQHSTIWTAKGSFLQVFGVKISGVPVHSSFIRLSFVVHCLFKKCLQPFIHRLRECYFFQKNQCCKSDIFTLTQSGTPCCPLFKSKSARKILNLNTKSYDRFGINQLNHH